VTWSQPQAENQRQQSVNDYVCCVLYNSMAVLRHLTIIEVLAAFIGNIMCVDTATQQNERQQSVNRKSTERQQSVNRASTEHQQSVNTASSQHQESVNRVSTILCVASWILQALCYSIYPESTYWQPLWAKEIATWSQPQSENERQQSANDFVCCILYNSRAVLRHLPIIEVLAAFIGNIVCVNTATPQAEHHQSVNRASIERQQSINTASTECQQRVSDFWCCILYTTRAVLRQLSIINILAAVMRKRDRDMVTAPVWEWMSTECQWFSVLHLV